MLGKKIYALFLGSMLGYSANAQDFNGLDYLRKLTVNREWVKKDLKEPFVPVYDNFSNPLSDEAKNSLDGIIMNVYFRTDESTLTKNDEEDIGEYILAVLAPYSENSTVSGFSIEGHADFRGDKKDNYVLSFERAQSVKNYLKKFFPFLEYYVSYFGDIESAPSMDPLVQQKDRVARITPNSNPLEKALKFMEGDVFLLDQSGSMNDDGWAWKTLQKHEFPRECDVYSFSKETNDEKTKILIRQRRSYNINTEWPAGSTPLYLSLDTLVSYMEKNKSITVIINGEDNCKGSTPEKIIKKANDKNISINLIAISINKEFEKPAREITQKTGGKHYFLKKE